MLSLFLDKNFSWEQLNSANLPLSEFATSGMKKTSDTSRYMYNRGQKYQELTNSYFYNSVDDIDHADAILMPADYSFISKRAPHVLHHFLALSEKSGKPLLISSLGDTTDEIPGRNTIVLRASKYRWSAKENEIFCPPVVDDRLSGKKIQVLGKKADRPSVGFVGNSIKPCGQSFPARHLSYGYKDYLKSILTPILPRFGVQRSGFYFRGRALDLLANDVRVDDNFIQRNYWGLETRHPEEQLRRQEFEYNDNIRSNLFTLCARGAANFSLRFYEVLSMGRIPLLINTDDLRPCEDLLNYHNFCFIVNSSDLGNLPKLLIDFYSSTSSNELIDMQHRAQAAFVEHLDFTVFSKNLFDRVIPNLIARGKKA